jgi:hypothetical protein
MDLYMDYTWFVYGLQAMVSIGVHMLCASHGMIELFFLYFFPDRVVISPFVIISPGLFHIYKYYIISNSYLMQLYETVYNI